MSESVAVIIGRWQILHRGHCSLLRAALAAAERVVVVIGSAWRARDAHNPFSWQERVQQFEAVLSTDERKRVVFVAVRDYFDDERWVAAVRAGVACASEAADAVTLIGCRRDHTSAYLDLFPGWRLVELEARENLAATDLRRMYFEATSIGAALAVLGNYVEPGVRASLESWALTPEYRRCATEHAAVRAYRERYTAPFYLTADAVVTADGHVLLIRRGGDIGHGLLALPGGFVDPLERFYPAAVRELAEETGYAPPREVLAAALRGQAVFDHPRRSSRGRIVTTAFHFDLGAVKPPEVHGQDDAKEAKWVPIADLPAIEAQLFEDHICILDHFCGVYDSEVSV